MSLELARTVADAVLFEGYLLYPYRASSGKNQIRWQFGVLGPPGAVDAGLGEDPELSAQCVLAGGAGGRVTVRVRFLQLQTRTVERATGVPDRFAPVDELTVGARSWLSWDEAVEHEVSLETCHLAELLAHAREMPVEVAGGVDVELLRSDDGAVAGRIVRRRGALRAVMTASADAVGEWLRLSLVLRNDARGPVTDKDAATGASLIGAHLLVSADDDADFVSLLEPPDGARDAVAACSQHRCWPVMTGIPGQCDLVLVSPIILYDYPQVAEQSAGALFDSTEIDEILTLRVMTLTDEEKAEARATDPRAAEIIDRCDAMSPEELAGLHGILRNPHGVGTPGIGALHDVSDGRPDVRDLDPPAFATGDVPWWDPEVDASVAPELDSVSVNGIPVSRGSLVRVRPARRADAQDLFFTGMTARVSAVHCDVDGNVHVAVVLLDDPAADLHEWYGRFLYFAPDEIEALSAPDPAGAYPQNRLEDSRKGTRS